MSPAEARSRLLTPTSHLAAEGVDTQRRLNSISIAAWRLPGSHVLDRWPNHGCHSRWGAIAGDTPHFAGVFCGDCGCGPQSKRTNLSAAVDVTRCPGRGGPISCSPRQSPAYSAAVMVGPAGRSSRRQAYGPGQTQCEASSTRVTGLAWLAANADSAAS